MLVFKSLFTFSKVHCSKKLYFNVLSRFCKYNFWQNIFIFGKTTKNMRFKKIFLAKLNRLFKILVSLLNKLSLSLIYTSDFEGAFFDIYEGDMAPTNETNCDIPFQCFFKSRYNAFTTLHILRN